MINDQVKKNSIDWLLVAVIIISSYIPIVMSQLYFRHDDSQTLLWAHEFTGNVLKVFNPSLWLGEYYKYPGVGGYYRPFESIYILFLLKIFGPNAAYFQFINGFLVVGTIIFMYKIAQVFSGKIAAFLSVIIFHLCFNSILYGNFHVVVPFGYFFELGCFYFAARGLVKSDHKSLLLSILFLIPATNRQTTAVILPAIVLVYLLSFWRNTFPESKTKYMFLSIAVLPNLMIGFSSNASTGTVLSESPNLQTIVSFLYERLLYYGTLLTNGLTGLTVISILTLFVMFNLLDSRDYLRMITSKVPAVVFLIVAALASGLFALIIMEFTVAAIFLSLTVLIFTLMTRKHLRYPVILFFMSLGCFFAISFYHAAYLLEAAYALSIVLGIILYETINKLGLSFDPKFIPTARRFGVVALGALALILFFWYPIHVPFISPKFKSVKVLIETNQNFKNMIRFVKDELPMEAEVYELANHDLGFFSATRRSWSLREKAEKVKVMNIENTRAMLKVLGRYDIKLKPARELDISLNGSSRYFIVCNNYEREIAENYYSLELIKEFRRGNTSAAVYLLKG